MDRKTIYSKDQQSRIVSVTNGLWQLQGHDNHGKGTNRQVKPPQEHRDPWFKRGAPSTKDEALVALG